jgi:hypothetical protein
MSYYFTEPSTTLDAVARITGRAVYVKSFIRVDDVSKSADWSTEYTEGPYLLTAFMLHADHGSKTSTLSVWLDGDETAIHSASCVVGSPNTNWLVGLVPGTAFDNAVGSLFAASSIKVGASAAHWYSYQLLQFDIG